MKRMNLLAGAWMVLLLAACSNDDTALDPTADTPITFQVGVAEADTRAESTPKPLASGSLGFYMQTSGTTNPRYKEDNRELVCRNGIGTPVGKPLLWKDKKEETSISWYAYYPYTNTDIDNGIMTVTIPTDQAAESVYDLLHAEGTATGGEVINIQLEHMLSKLIVNLTPGTVLGDDVIFKSVVLTDLSSQVTFNVSNTEQIVLPGNIMSSLDEDVKITMRKVDNTTFEAIILPFNPSIMGVEITLDGETEKKFYYKRGFTQFKQGQIHTLNLQVGENSEDNNTITSATWKQEEWPVSDLHPIQQPTIKLQP